MQSYDLNLAKVFVISNLWMTFAFMAMSQLVVRAENSYSFACNSIKSGKRVIPTTMILFSNGASKPLISWESNFIRNPKQQCEQVSRRFEDFSRLGNLHFLKFASDRKTGQTIICGLSRSDKDRSCDKSNKLFELSKTMNDPKKVLTGIRNSLVMVGDNSIPQTPDDSQTIDLAASIDWSQLDR